MGSRLVSYYFEMFESKAKHLLATVGKMEEDDKVVATVVESKDIRSALDNFAVVTRNHADASISALLGWRTRLRESSSNKEKSLREELAADTLLIRACIQILLQNDTWLHHWALRTDLGLQHVSDDTSDALFGWVVSRARYWYMDQPLADGRRRVAEMIVELLGQISRVRFPHVWTELAEGLRQQVSKGDSLQGKAEREVHQAMRLLRCVRLPQSEASARVSFFQMFNTCSQKTHKNKELKRAICEVLTNAVAPMATRIHITATQQEEISLLSSLWQTAERWAKKPKHIAAAFPLMTALLCATPLVSPLHEKIDVHFDTVVKRLQDEKDRKLRCMYLESLLHLTGHYLLFVLTKQMPSLVANTRYIPPPPDDPSVLNAAMLNPVRKEPPKGDSEIPTKLATACTLLASMGRKQGISGGHSASRMYALCVDIVVLLCRTRPKGGVGLVLSLLPTVSDLKEVYSESSLVGLYSLLCCVNLANHFQPQGAVEEHGVSQGIALHWWALGVPNGRGPENQAVRLRSQFTSFRPPSPAAAVLWSNDRCLSPSLNGLWSMGSSLLLDTSTLCMSSVLAPHVMHYWLAKEAQGLSARISAVLTRCEKDLTSGGGGGRWEKKLGGVLEGNDKEKERTNAHVFRMVLLVSVYVVPGAMKADEYFALLMRMAIHPNADLREAVSCTVLPQILLMRPPLVAQLLQSAADILLARVDDMDAALLILQMLLRLLSLLCCSLDHSKRASIPFLASQMIGRSFQPIGTFRPSETPRDPIVQLESACLVFLSVPYIEVKGKSFALLQWIARLTAMKNSPVYSPPNAVRVLAVLERELVGTEKAVGAMVLEATSPAAEGQKGARKSYGSQSYPDDLPECLKGDAVPLSASAKIVLFSPVWAHCAGFVTEHLVRCGSEVPMIACNAISLKFSSVVQRAMDTKGDAAEDRRAEELCLAYAMVMAAGCEHKASVLFLILALLKGHSAVLAETAVLAMTVVPRTSVTVALDQLRALDDEARALTKKEKTRRTAWLLRGLIVRAYGRVLQRTQQSDWLDSTRTQDVADWMGELVDELVSPSMERMLCVDQVAGLKCRADVLETISVLTSLFHQHVHGRCIHHIDQDKRRKWIAFCISLSQLDAVSVSMRPSRSTRDESLLTNVAESIDTLQGLVRGRAKVAASCLLAGPLLVQPDMVWIDDCAAGRVSHEMNVQDTGADIAPALATLPLQVTGLAVRGVTYPLIITFIHSLLPPPNEAVTFSVWGDDRRTAEMQPPVSASWSRYLKTANSRLNVGGATLAFRCMNALLKCNVSCPGLVRASAALALHKNGAVAKLHLCTLANAVCSGTMLPRPTLPMVLAAVVCGIADLDEELRMASWRLIPFICPQLDVRHYPRTKEGASNVVAAAAKVLPEAGAVLVSLAKDRLPMFSTARRIRLLAALSHWASYLKPDTPSDVDELLSLTESYYGEHPVVLHELWRKIGSVESIITRLQERCVSSLVQESARADDPDVADLQVRGSPWELCDVAFSMVTHTEVILHHISRLLTPHQQYVHRAATALVFAAQIFNDVSGNQMVPLLAGVLHAISVVGCNHPKIIVCKKSRILLRSLLAFEGTRPTAARDRLLDLLFVSEGAYLTIDSSFVQSLVASRPLGTDILRTWTREVLICIKSSETPVTVRKRSIRLYTVLTQGVPDDNGDFEALAGGLVVCINKKDEALAAACLSAITPVTLRLMWSARYIPSVWSVLSLIRCREAPMLVEAAAHLCNLSLPALPPPALAATATMEALAHSSVHTLVRAALSQMFLVPPCTHDALLQLLQIILKGMQTWDIPPLVLYHYHCMLVGCLLPELCMRFPQHSVQGYVKNGGFFCMYCLTEG